MNQTFNETDTDFLEEYFSFMILYLKLFRADFFMDCIMLPLGIVLQTWLLLAIVTSPDMRRRMRNKIIASFCVQHLLECLISLPLNMDLDHRVFFGEVVDCHQLYALSNIILMQDFITNWTLVIFVAVYLAQVCDFKPQARLPDLPACRAAFAFLNKPVVAAFALLASPWMIAFVMFPTMIKYSRTILAQEHLGDCFFDFGDGYYIFKSVDTAVPLFSALGLLVTAVAFRRRRPSGGISGTESRSQGELAGRGPDVDSWYPYAAAMSVVGVCEIGLALSFIMVIGIDYKKSLVLERVSGIMTGVKVTLIAFPWLLFPDVRERLRTWRPWRRERGHADLTLVFTKEQS